MKDNYQKKFHGDFVYTKRQLFCFKDGGKTYLDFMGDFVSRPILFIAPGLTSDSQTGYIRAMVRQAYARGFDVCVINYRGLAGCQLYTPKLFNSNAYMDVLEPIKEISAQNKDRKIFAVGCSMGANILANMLGYEGKVVDAAVIVQAPMKKWCCGEAIKTSLFGIYDKAMGESLNKIMLRHEPVFREYF